MDGLVGLLKVRVVRGINLAYRDARGSDPYVVLRLGKQVSALSLLLLLLLVHDSVLLLIVLVLFSVQKYCAIAETEDQREEAIREPYLA